MHLLSVSHSYFFFIFIFCYIYTSSHWLSCWWQPGHFDQCWCSSMLVLGPGSWQLGGDWAGIRTCHGLIWPWLWPGHFDQYQCSSTLVLGPKTTISKPSRAWLDSGTACSCILDTSQLLQHMEKGTQQGSLCPWWWPGCSDQHQCSTTLFLGPGFWWAWRTEIKENSTTWQYLVFVDAWEGIEQAKVSEERQQRRAVHEYQWTWTL